MAGTANLGMLQVVKDTVDQGIHSLAERKLQLDAAVLKSMDEGDGELPTTEAAAMQQVLQGLLQPSAQAGKLDAGQPNSNHSKLQWSAAAAPNVSPVASSSEHAASPGIISISDD